MNERLPGQEPDDERTPEQRWRAAARWRALDVEMSRVGVRIMRMSGLNFCVLTERPLRKPMQQARKNP